jgi:hypothetical protein
MPGIKQRVGIGNTYEIECYDSAGNLKWRETVPNSVVNTGLDDILDKYWLGSGYTATHYVGVTSGTPTISSADTMASHTGWQELGDIYDEASRPALTWDAVGGDQTVSTSKAAFTINSNATIGGALVSTGQSKELASGTLIGVAAFTGGDRTVANGDTVNVTITSAASDG